MWIRTKDSNQAEPKIPRTIVAMRSRKNTGDFLPLVLARSAPVVSKSEFRKTRADHHRGNQEHGMFAVQTELRRRVRHRLAAEAVFTWRSAEGGWLHGEGVTRDLSVGGAFLFSLTSPPVGATIHLDVLLFPLEGGTRSLRLKTEGTVIRVEHGSDVGNEGFAVVLEGLNLGEGCNDQ